MSGPGARRPTRLPIGPWLCLGGAGRWSRAAGLPSPDSLWFPRERGPTSAQRPAADLHLETQPGAPPAGPPEKARHAKHHGKDSDREGAAEEDSGRESAHSGPPRTPVQRAGAGLHASTRTWHSRGPEGEPGRQGAPAAGRSGRQRGRRGPARRGRQEGAPRAAAAGSPGEPAPQATPAGEAPRASCRTCWSCRAAGLPTPSCPLPTAPRSWAWNDDRPAPSTQTKASRAKRPESASRGALGALGCWGAEREGQPPAGAIAFDCGKGRTSGRVP